jgi:hypothetical protein
MSANYFELIIEGHEDFVKGFVRGVLYGKGSQARVIFNNENNIKRSSIVESIKAFFDAPTALTHVILDEEPATTIKNAVEEVKSELTIDFKEMKRIASACFKFEYEAYARNYGERLKHMFATLPNNVLVSEDYSPEEILHPESRGIEKYAPEHDYEIRAHGTVSGPLDEILEFHKQGKREPLVDVSDIELTLE